MKFKKWMLTFLVVAALCSGCQSNNDANESHSAEHELTANNNIEYDPSPTSATVETIEHHFEEQEPLVSPDSLIPSTEIEHEPPDIEIDPSQLILLDREKAACPVVSGPGVKGQSIFSSFYEEGEAEPLSQHIETNEYELMIPSGWEVPNYLPNNLLLHFTTKERELKDEQAKIVRSASPGLIGGIHTIAYEPDEAMYPNYNLDLSAVEAHCELIEESLLPGSIMRYSLLEVVERSTGEAIAQYAQIEFFVRERKQIYKLYFYTDDVNKATAFNIAKSFKLIDSAANS